MKGGPSSGHSSAGPSASQTTAEDAAAYPAEINSQRPFRVGSSKPFIICLCLLGGFYVLLILLMVLADLRYVVREGDGVAARVSNTIAAVAETLKNPDIRFSIKLSLISCTVSAIVSVWVAVPIGYLLSRFKLPVIRIPILGFRVDSKYLVDGILDIPIVLPPLVVGFCLLILFNYAPFSWVSQWVVFEWSAVIIAQFVVACAFAVRTMRVTFDHIPQRFEQVAMTLGCNRSKAFWMVVLPQAREGLLAAGTLAWARSLGEFGPILVFAGATRQRTEVLSTSFFLEMQAGNLFGMCVISLTMILCSAVVLTVARLFGMKRLTA